MDFVESTLRAEGQPLSSTKVEAGELPGCATYISHNAIFLAIGLIDTDQSNEKQKIRKQSRIFSHTCSSILLISYSIWIARSPSGILIPVSFHTFIGLTIPKRSAHYISSPLQVLVNDRVPRARCISSS